MNKPTDPEAVLYAFAVEASHDRSTLERYLKQYPELAEELIDLSSELRLNETLPSEPTSGQADLGLDGAWKEFLGCKPEQPATSGAADLFGRYKGQAFVNLATTLNIPRSILTALRDGLVDPASIPKGFISRFANATTTPFNTVKESLSRSQEASVALAFKSDVKPGHQGQTTFRKLIQNTEMTEEQRLLLLRECDEDELP
jgi:hypothetical protein